MLVVETIAKVRRVVLGSPGRVVREISEEELKELLHSAHGYVEEAAIYRADASAR